MTIAHLKIGFGGSGLAILPVWRIVGGILMLVFAMALVYSLYIEIPTQASYLETGHAPLITTGTYSLSRHPGVFWYIFFGLGFALASANIWAILATPVWIALNIGLAWLQDNFYFPQMFSGYGEYKTTTPFLIPTRLSIRNFSDSLRN